ncbi:MAG: DUF5666 domain-containing protein [Caldilinea sp.]|nr:DUF5666 domain-containing protein [Caldilinea sp.]
MNQATSRMMRLAVLALAVVLAAAVWTGNRASAQELNWIGRVSAMPASGLVGQWTVNGRTFVSSASTDYRQDKGPLAVGVCVEVEYVGAGEPFTATKIASKSDDNCTAGTSTPSATPSGTPSATPSATPTAPALEREAYGTVSSMPASGFVGLWVVNGVTYNAPAGAEFKQRSGPLMVGACVKLHYNDTTSPFTVRELESRPTDDCTGATPAPTSTSTPGATSTPSNEFEVYGRVDSFPAGLVGEWVVGGVRYTATSGTEFEQEYGAFAAGACVKIHGLSTTSPATIREIETEREYKCSGSAGGGATPVAGEAEIYGALQSFPAGLVGEWNVAGMTFVADASTEFKQRNGPFEIGGTVKVHFSTDAAGVNRAREIETKFAGEDSGSDDNGNGSVDGAEGHAYGIADVVPDGLVGTWTIGGIDYTATQSTRFGTSDGALVAGARVKVEYVLSGGARVAKQIERTDDTGGATAPANFKVFGYVEQMPANGWNGTWTVDGVTYIAGATTKFKENNGLLGLGAYVAVEYFMQNGQKQLHEIETHVPPGAGSQLAVGRIDDKGGARAAAVQATTWTVAGVSYAVIPATNFSDALGALEVGSTAVVDSYVAANGTLVATQIRGITLNNALYMPAVQR